MGVSRLDDEDYPALTMGQAAELLGVQPAFLRSLDTAGVLAPHRSTGGHRRYSRRQLEIATRMRELFDQGLSLDAATRILNLQDQLDDAHARITELEHPTTDPDHNPDTRPDPDPAREPAPHTHRGAESGRRADT
ncbi:helix-turn-helix domain-containing protein [Pseudonocardia endophytica]|uniref:MerR-like DNA binding protein n=1 Tax=Pseudonocardia endophytica TaxID=401976 RepID=A0A4R1HG22_PSEEN|nr:helix-turn-helix domain-containing protein [Pseudonocardia endophytica]TCK21097.1 MerR-like DNA binding protein [Pseudonocardia endophytica]